MEAKAALDPTGTNSWLADWSFTTYPCPGNRWRAVTGCSNDRVQYLQLARQGLDGSLPTTWGAFPGLEHLTQLYLQGNALKGTLPASWGGLTSLKFLHLHSNPGLTGTIPCSWATVGNRSIPWLEKPYPYLSTLALGNTSLVGCYPTQELQAAAASFDKSLSVDKSLGSKVGPSPVSGVRGE